ncbi:hypothetical protein JOQ06_002023 [Pogonophryne albipinna]|uniref:Uncharacterized protein n=1 Tax=Pogonophryne albipinna TaxID=1090488 RepID=A0AAD6F616_9TELE|nr:hypothetical protein JOQ06_002023 [Pogonophryne albipinna]
MHLLLLSLLLLLVSASRCSTALFLRGSEAQQGVPGAQQGVLERRSALELGRSPRTRVLSGARSPDRESRTHRGPEGTPRQKEEFLKHLTEAAMHLLLLSLLLLLVSASRCSTALFLRGSEAQQGVPGAPAGGLLERRRCPGARQEPKDRVLSGARSPDRESRTHRGPEELHGRRRSSSKHLTGDSFY